MYNNYNNIFRIASIPDYVGSCEGTTSSIVIIYGLQEKALNSIYDTNAFTYCKDNIYLRFFELSNEVIEDNLLTSSPNKLSSHPSYLKLLSMGKPVLPFLLFSLDYYPTFWFPALRLITDVNPVREENIGNIPKMVEDWKIWAIENDYDSKHAYFI
jgi:hypothetical protein